MGGVPMALRSCVKLIMVSSFFLSLRIFYCALVVCDSTTVVNKMNTKRRKMSRAAPHPVRTQLNAGLLGS